MQTMIKIMPLFEFSMLIFCT